MSRVICVIQARRSSTRLPDKVLADLSGRPLLAHVVERAQAIRGVDAVVLTTPREDLEALSEYVGLLSGGIVTHMPPDVLGGFALAAWRLDADVIVRLTADCPLLDPELATHALRTFGGGPSPFEVRWPRDYVGTTRPRLAVPDGLDVEVFTRQALEVAHREATGDDREHVTSFLWRQPERFRLGTFAPVCDRTCWSRDCQRRPFGACWALGLKLSVDTEDDLARVRAIHARIPAGDYSLAATLRAAKEVGL